MTQTLLSGPTRPLGRSGLSVARYTFGAAPLGNLFTPLSDDQALETVDAAWQAGFRCFDVAPHYGLGLAEERLGRALAVRPRHSYVISTKVGRLIEPGTSPHSDRENGFAVTTDRVRRLDYSRDGVLRSIEDSLNRLGLDRIDVVLVHDPELFLREALEAAFPTLDELRRQGVIASYGAAANTTPVLIDALRETDSDIVLSARHFTLLQNEAAELLLPLAERRGVSVIVAGVLGQGRLTSENAPADLRRLCEESNVSLLSAALGFPALNPAVTTIAVGMRSPDEVAANVQAIEHPPSPAFWAALAAAGA